MCSWGIGDGAAGDGSVWLGLVGQTSLADSAGRGGGAGAALDFAGRAGVGLPLGIASDRLPVAPPLATATSARGTGTSVPQLGQRATFPANDAGAFKRREHLGQTMLIVITRVTGKRATPRLPL
ncbi:MAG TPA: hypothetical protein VG713_20350 [Pirellulales bacterium]|nr:hypothetical protein [Pirellulales bacterium]